MRSVDQAIPIDSQGKYFQALPSRWHSSIEAPRFPKFVRDYRRVVTRAGLTFLNPSHSLLDYDADKEAAPALPVSLSFQEKSPADRFLENPTEDQWIALTGAERKGIIAKIEHTLSPTDKAYLDICYLESSEKTVIRKIVEIIAKTLEKKSPDTVRTTIKGDVWGAVKQRKK